MPYLLDYLIAHALSLIGKNYIVARRCAFLHKQQNGDVHSFQRNWLNNNSGYAPHKNMGFRNRGKHKQHFVTNTYSTLYLKLLSGANDKKR